MWKSAAVVLFAAVVLSSLLYGTTLIFGVCSSWNATLEERSEAQRFQTLRCGHCMNLSQAPTVSSISCEQFTELYAKTGRPLIVTDALPTSALKGMSLSEAVSYIKDIYLRSVISGKEDEFFNEFRNVLDGNYDQEHFRKTEDVFVYASIENVTSTAWYFNWRSFNDEFVANRHVLVPTPYCFSSWSYPEMDMLEFFFANPREDRPITSFGRHVDTPESSGTWHAQLAGVKVWELWPPIQCNEVCKPINVTTKVGYGSRSQLGPFESLHHFNIYLIVCLGQPIRVS